MVVAMMRVILLSISLAFASFGSCFGLNREGLQEAFTRAQFINQPDNQLIKLAATFLHIPYILTLDSDDQRVARWAALCAALVTTSKVVDNLAQKHDLRLIQIMLWYLPKMELYMKGSVYDLFNTFRSDFMLEMRKNKSAELLSAVKTEQAVNLLAEIALRALSCWIRYSSLEDNLMNHNQRFDIIAFMAAEVADLLELWRLHGRLKTVEQEQWAMPWKIKLKKLAGFDCQEDNPLQDGSSVEPFSELQ